MVMSIEQNSLKEYREYLMGPGPHYMDSLNVELSSEPAN